MVPAFLYTPAGLAADHKAAALVWVHGGPEFQARPTFDPVSQYFVDAGYAVLFPNIRAPPATGRLTPTPTTSPGGMTPSLTSSSDGVIWPNGPGADPFKIGILGSSYGGYMTLMQLVSSPYRWAAGVDIRGIANFVTYMENTGPWRVELRGGGIRLAGRRPRRFGRLSPMTYMYRLRAPLMVIHAPATCRVPIEEAEQVVAAARASSATIR